jgi:hypothetical protein
LPVPGIFLFSNDIYAYNFDDFDGAVDFYDFDGV